MTDCERCQSGDHHECDTTAGETEMCACFRDWHDVGTPGVKARTR